MNECPYPNCNFYICNYKVWKSVHLMFAVVIRALQELENLKY